MDDGVCVTVFGIAIHIVSNAINPKPYVTCWTCAWHTL